MTPGFVEPSSSNRDRWRMCPKCGVTLKTKRTRCEYDGFRLTPRPDETVKGLTGKLAMAAVQVLHSVMLRLESLPGPHLFLAVWAGLILLALGRP